MIKMFPNDFIVVNGRKFEAVGSTSDKDSDNRSDGMISRNNMLYAPTSVFANDNASSKNNASTAQQGFDNTIFNQAKQQIQEERKSSIDFNSDYGKKLLSEHQAKEQIKEQQKQSIDFNTDYGKKLLSEHQLKEQLQEQYQMSIDFDSDFGKKLLAEHKTVKPKKARGTGKASGKGSVRKADRAKNKPETKPAEQPVSQVADAEAEAATKKQEAEKAEAARRKQEQKEQKAQERRKSIADSFQKAANNKDKTAMMATLEMYNDDPGVVLSLIEVSRENKENPHSLVYNIQQVESKTKRMRYLEEFADTCTGYFKVGDDSIKEELKRAKEDNDIDAYANACKKLEKQVYEKKSDSDYQATLKQDIKEKGSDSIISKFKDSAKSGNNDDFLKATLEIYGNNPDLMLKLADLPKKENEGTQSLVRLIQNLDIPDEKRQEYIGNLTKMSEEKLENRNGAKPILDDLKRQMNYARLNYDTEKCENLCKQYVKYANCSDDELKAETDKLNEKSEAHKKDASQDARSALEEKDDNKRITQLANRLKEAMTGSKQSVKDVRYILENASSDDIAEVSKDLSQREHTLVYFIQHADFSSDAKDEFYSLLLTAYSENVDSKTFDEVMKQNQAYNRYPEERLDDIKYLGKQAAAIETA